MFKLTPYASYSNLLDLLKWKALNRSPNVDLKNKEHSKIYKLIPFM